MLCSNAQIIILIHYLSCRAQQWGVLPQVQGQCYPSTARTTGQPGCTISGSGSLITAWIPEQNPGGQGNPGPAGDAPTQQRAQAPHSSLCRARRYRGNGAAEPRGPVTRQRRPGPARALPGRRPVATATITLPSLAASLGANAEK